MWFLYVFLVLFFWLLSKNYFLLYIWKRLKYVNFKLMSAFVRVVGLTAREVFLSVFSTTGNDKITNEQHK